jgi:hypothetical protein
MALEASVIQKCYKQAEFISRIQKAMGITMGPVSCHVVDKQGMTNVMAKKGWNASQTSGVVGFQVGEKVYVLNSAPWTVLHELIHRAGVNSDRISQYVAEGLTEAIASELKTSPDEHRATYPTESKWVKTSLLPLLGLSATQLGSILAKSRNPPRTLAQMIAKKKPGTNVARLTRQFRPQNREQPSFNRGVVTRVSRCGDDTDSSCKTGWILITAGSLLLLPALVRGRGNA